MYPINLKLCPFLLELWEFKSGVEALLEPRVHLTRHRHTKSNERKDKRRTHMEARENSGAQQWLCTRSAYSIFHHYGREKKPNYWSAPLLPCLPAALFHSLLIPSSISSFNRLSLSEICKQNKTFLKLIPAVNRGIKMQAPLRNELHQQHVHRREGGGQTQSTPAQSNAIRHQSAAINIVFEKNF